MVGLGDSLWTRVRADGLVQQAAAVFEFCLPAHGAGSYKLMEYLAGWFPVEARDEPVQQGQPGSQFQGKQFA